MARLKKVQGKYTTVEKKKYRTLFMVICFSMLLAMTTSIPEFLTRLLFQIILFVGQLLIVKLLLDDYYGD